MAPGNSLAPPPDRGRRSLNTLDQNPGGNSTPRWRAPAATPRPIEEVRLRVLRPEPRQADRLSQDGQDLPPAAARPRGRQRQPAQAAARRSAGRRRAGPRAARGRLRRGPVAARRAVARRDAATRSPWCARSWSGSSCEMGLRGGGWAGGRDRLQQFHGAEHSSQSPRAGHAGHALSSPAALLLRTHTSPVQVRTMVARRPPLKSSCRAASSAASRSTRPTIPSSTRSRGWPWTRRWAWPT